jgi:hypothetical protein
MMLKNKTPLTAVMVPALKSCFETMINLKENNFNFGETIYLKSRAERMAEKYFGT